MTSPRPRRRAIIPALALALVLAALLASAAVGCSSSSAQDDDAPTATTLAPGAAGTMADPQVSDEVLAAEFLRVLESEDEAALDEVLSAGFLLQRADGTHIGKETYLANPAVVDHFQVTDVAGTRVGDTRAVRYTATVTEAIDGQEITKAPVPRLTTFVWEDGRWRLLAHANFAALPNP